MARSKSNPTVQFAAPQGVPTAPSANLVANLNRLVADLYTFYVTAHGFHWNVEGDEFVSYHEFFGEIYGDVHDSIDAWAENIRKIGAYAPFRLDDLVQLREIADSTVTNGPASDLVQVLYDQNEGVLSCLNEAFATSTAANEQGIANFAAERIDQHQKWAWQLRSLLVDDGDDAMDQPTTDQQPTD